MLKINGVAMPTPSEMTHSIYDITDGERDSTGTMHIDLIATKYKLECKWNVLTQANMTKILNTVNAITFSISFVDPVTGEEKTMNVYKGDRSIPIFKITNGENVYKDFKINFIEL